MKANSIWRYRIVRVTQVISLVTVALVATTIVSWFESAQGATKSSKNVGVLRVSSIHPDDQTFFRSGFRHWKLSARKRVLRRVWKKYGYKRVRLADLNVLTGAMKRVARVEGFLDGQQYVRFYAYRWPSGLHLIDDALLAQGEPKVYRLEKIGQGQHYDLFRVGQSEAIGSRLSEIHMLPYNRPHDIDQILQEQVIDQEINQAMRPWLTQGYKIMAPREVGRRMKRANSGAKGILIKEHINSSRIEVWRLENLGGSRGLQDFNLPSNPHDTRWNQLSEYLGESYFKLVEEETPSLSNQTKRGRSTDPGGAFGATEHGNHRLVRQLLGSTSPYCRGRPYMFRYGDGFLDCNVSPR